MPECEKCGNDVGTANYICGKCGGARKKTKSTCTRCGGKGKVRKGENHHFAFPLNVLTLGLLRNPEYETCGNCNGNGYVIS
jgi:uncharacterized paraquat-inducible protein A